MMTTDFERELRDAMKNRADAVEPVTLSPDQAYGRVATGVVRDRRKRTTMAGSAATALLVGGLVLGNSLAGQPNSAQLTPATHSVTDAKTGRAASSMAPLDLSVAAPMDTWAPRGSLVNDTALLAQASAAAGGGMRLVYAGDVAGRRLLIMHSIDGSLVTWRGQAGAPFDQLIQDRLEGWDGSRLFAYSTESSGGGSVVVIAPPGTASVPVSYAPTVVDGTRVTRTFVALALADGIGIVPMGTRAAGAFAALTNTGGNGISLSGPDSGPPAEPVVDGAVPSESIEPGSAVVDAELNVVHAARTVARLWNAGRATVEQTSATVIPNRFALTQVTTGTTTVQVSHTRVEGRLFLTASVSSLRPDGTGERYTPVQATPVAGIGARTLYFPAETANGPTNSAAANTSTGSEVLVLPTAPVRGAVSVRLFDGTSVVGTGPLDKQGYAIVRMSAYVPSPVAQFVDRTGAVVATQQLTAPEDSDPLLTNASLETLNRR